MALKTEERGGELPPTSASREIGRRAGEQPARLAKACFDRSIVGWSRSWESPRRRRQHCRATRARPRLAARRPEQDPGRIDVRVAEEYVEAKIVAARVLRCVLGVPPALPLYFLPLRSAFDAASSLSGVTLSGSTRIIRYVMWSWIFVNQCPVPAGITIASPAFS
jgi:hypothetical protein